MRNKKVYSLVAAALIAAMYAVLTFVVAQFAYGAVQLRVSEALTILPMYTP
ncbi:MAG: QueT transporter family protein, partial [Massilioclostridium sp.]|nr:QueT transporter family protein [Massilioclostridium sp.]